MRSVLRIMRPRRSWLTPVTGSNGRPGLKPGTRELVAIWPYMIAYRITSDAVEILNVWHGAQNRT